MSDEQHTPKHSAVSIGHTMPWRTEQDPSYLPGTRDQIVDVNGNAILHALRPPVGRLIVRAVNQFSALRQCAEALRLATNELNAIRARDGAPPHIQWGENGRAFVTPACSEDWWNELTDQCFAALAALAEAEKE